MSEQGWDKQGIFGPPIVRQEVVEAPVQVERPIDLTAAPVTAPPEPGQAPPTAEAATDAPPDPALTVAELGLALYLLHGLHAPDRPGYEHLVRQGTDEAEADDDRRGEGVHPLLPETER